MWRSVLSLCLLAWIAGCEPPKPGVRPTAPGSTTGGGGTATPSQEVATTPGVTETPGFQPVAASLTTEQIRDGWIQLFDGETLFGWKPNSEMNWRVEQGVIVADEGKPGLLQTTSRFADYELKCDFRVAAGGNSGIFLRTPFKPSDPATDCYELNACDSHPEFKSGSLVKRAQPSKAITADGEWHTFHVRLLGPQVTVQFDGEPILDYKDETAAPLAIGHIGLQMNGGRAEFRNVFLKPLSTQSLFDGTSLAGWRPVPGSKSQFDVEEGTIHVKNGPGFLETEAPAKNFVFQFEAQTNGDKLNGGVFFRALPGTEAAPSHGYEFQIQNGYKDGDRTKPDDHGTGAIFRRVAARKVVPDDREWFAATLIAEGPHFATWVNGTPVVDWTDERPSDENPRKGLRLDAGHFSLQGHDATTDISFRNLKLANLPE